MTDRLDGFVPLFLRKAAIDPDGVFARVEGHALTFATLDRMSAAFAAALAARGIGTGSRVAVMMHNGPQALATLIGIARAGAVWVPINARLRGDNLRYVLDHCDPRALVADATLMGTIADSGADHPRAWVITHGDGSGCLSELLDGSARGPVQLPAPDDLFAIMYTSGTTGRPKGVMVTHYMMRLAGEAVAQVSEARGGDVFFVWEPLYHIGGAQLMVLPLIRDVQLAMVDRFSASRFWEQVRIAAATHIHYLGGILQLLLKQPPRPDDRDHPVRIAWGGGCPAEIWRAFEDRFGVRIRECYGMTEASSITTCNDHGVVGSVGRPMPWFEVELAGEGGRKVELGGKGEIVVRTTLPGAIFAGYFRNPDATGRALRDGALHTGDLGSRDPDGNLVFHGRITDSVRCRGENVSAWEVEHVVAGHPAVEDCAVVGVDADIGEQDVKLFIMPKADARLGAAELSAWLATRLAIYQMPRYIAVVEAFERTPSQRIMKHRLSPSREDCWDRLRPET